MQIVKYSHFSTYFLDCEMETIGKAVYHNVMSQKYGSWMKDSNVMDNSDVYWITTGSQNNTLLEFANKPAFTAHTPTKIYNLPDTIMVSFIKIVKKITGLIILSMFSGQRPRDI